MAPAGPGTTGTWRKALPPEKELWPIRRMAIWSGNIGCHHRCRWWQAERYERGAVGMAQGLPGITTSKSMFDRKAKMQNVRTLRAGRCGGSRRGSRRAVGKASLQSFIAGGKPLIPLAMHSDSSSGFGLSPLSESQ